MSYTPTNWQTGDTVTAALLNKMEQGISGGGALFVHLDFDYGTLDKTWQEIHDAAEIIPVALAINDDPYIDVYYLTNVSYPNNEYTCTFSKTTLSGAVDITFTAETSSSYPVIVE